MERQDATRPESLEGAPGEGLHGAAVSEQAEDLGITEDRSQLLAEKADLQDRLLRRQAEFENYRRRVEREKMEFTQYAAGEAVNALLPILDDFERALKQESADKEFRRGMELIYQRFSDTLKKLGLEPINSVGQAFDPYIHQAIDREETDEAEDHTILEEYQPGYRFKGRLLRPAMVKVAVRSSSPSNSDFLSE